MSYAFKVNFSDIQPTEPSWFLADMLTRREFARLVVQLVLQAKDKELAAGLDRHGRPLVPISEYTYKHRKSAMGRADPNAPPLTPAYGLSRTRSLLDGRAHADHALFFWRQDPVTGKSWGRILGYHRDGAGRLPVRDVIGMSTRSMDWVKEQVARWWEAKQRILAFYTGELDLALPFGATLPRFKLPETIKSGGRIYTVHKIEGFTSKVYHTQKPAAAQTAAPKPGDFRSGLRQVIRKR